MSTTQDDKVGEGSLDDDLAPPTPLKTSIVPILRMGIEEMPSLTGTTETVMMSEDDDQLDYQDAPITSQEAKSADTHPRTDATTIKNAPEMEKDKTLVLVVEDTVELGEVILATLENMGLKTAYATHGKQGLTKMRELNPQVLMMDIGLPDITGWKMLDDIKEHYELQKLPLPIIIVITAYGDPANRLIGKLQNIYTYLLKPFTPDEVENVINKALKGENPPDINDAKKLG